MLVELIGKPYLEVFVKMYVYVKNLNNKVTSKN